MEDLDQELEDKFRTHVNKAIADRVWRQTTRAWMNERRSIGLRRRHEAKLNRQTEQVPRDDSEAYRASQEAA